MADLVVPVKQGEDIVINFTVRQDGSPLDLSTYEGLRVEAKKSPYEKSEPLFSKLVTSVSDAEEVGNIYNPAGGQFSVRFNKEDTSFPVNDYYLVIYLQGNGEDNIISSNPCNEAIYRICTQ